MENRVTWRVPCREHRRHAGHDVLTVLEEGHLRRKRHDIGEDHPVVFFRRGADTFGRDPEIILDLVHHISRVGKCRATALHQAPDVIAMEMAGAPRW